ncbi:MAG: glycosyltransferase family 1 protein, partial [Pedobacter sp.]
LTYSKHQSDVLKEKYSGKTVYTIPLPLIGFGDAVEVPKVERFTKFLFFGNILHYKGLDILLKSVGRLSKTHSNFKLVIAGRSNDWAETYAPLIAEDANIEAHIGFIENDDIPGYFADADYLVLPYRDTTQSGPLMIAYNYNTPILASNAEGFKEFFKDGESGYSYDQQIPNDIDRVLVEAIERSNKEYIEIKQRQAEYVEDHFSVEGLSNAYELMFDKVAGKRLIPSKI